MTNKIIFFVIFTLSSALAADLKFEPVYSIETTRREYPLPANQVTKTFLGARALYGVPLVSAELELAQSTYTESFPSRDSEVTSVTRRAMLGVRSYPLTSKNLGVFIRAGVRAKQENLDIKENGEKRTEELPTYIDPYAGAGVSLALADNLAINAGATLVANGASDANGEKQYDMQYTLSASFRMGNR